MCNPSPPSKNSRGNNCWGAKQQNSVASNITSHCRHDPTLQELEEDLEDREARLEDELRITTESEVKLKEIDGGLRPIMKEAFVQNERAGKLFQASVYVVPSSNAHHTVSTFSLM